jgi:hypothetical protein
MMVQSMWQYIPVCVLPRMLWWLWKRASRGRRETALRRYAGSAVEYPIHAVGFLQMFGPHSFGIVSLFTSPTRIFLYVYI